MSMRGTLFLSTGNSGWSESYYYPGSNTGTLINSLDFLGTLRANCAPVGVSVIGLRASAVDPAGFAQVKSVSKPGSVGSRDAAFTSLQIVVNAGASSRRQFLMRGIPDDNVIGGQYSASGLFPGRLNAFQNSLISAGAQLRVIDRTMPIIPYLSVTGGGVIAFAVDPGWTAGNVVRFFRSYDDVNTSIRGAYTVADGADALHRVLLGWRAGRTSSGGKIRKQVIDFVNVSSFDLPSRVVSHKVGRPFGLAVGRVSRRR